MSVSSSSVPSDLSSTPPLPLSSPHPHPAGYIFESPGAHLTYRVIGPCCRLYDRDQLPWPCCRIQWRSKEPSWRRVGKRFTVDLSTRKHPSYCVEIIGQSYRSEPLIMTLYTEKLSSELQNWWHTKRVKPANESDAQTNTAEATSQAKPDIKLDIKKAAQFQRMSAALMT